MMQRAPPWSCSMFCTGCVAASFTCSTFRTGHQFLVPEARSLARRAVLSTFDFKIMKSLMNTIVVIIMIMNMMIYLFDMMIILKVPRAGNGQRGQCVQYDRLLTSKL